MPYVFPEPPYAVRKFINLEHHQATEGDQPDLVLRFFASKRWARVRDLWERRIRAPKGMKPQAPEGLWVRFWRHTGGRMAGGQGALIFSARLDSPYIRCAEEVPAVHYLDLFLSKLAGRASADVREAELFVHRGCYSHWTGFNEYFARDFADEARYRDTRGVVNGWHHLESLGLRKVDRRSMYWEITSSWSREWEPSRYLAVPSPLITVHAVEFLRNSEDEARLVLERMINAEMLQNTVLSLVRAAFVGIPWHGLSDSRMGRDWNRNPCRLFKLPWAHRKRLLSHIHPFFFLHGLRDYEVDGEPLDPVLAFLALRRSIEFEWDMSAAPAASYRWHSGEVRGLEFDLTTMRDGEDVPNQPFDVDQAVSTLSTLEDAQRAYDRFRELCKVFGLSERV